MTICFIPISSRKEKTPLKPKNHSPKKPEDSPVKVSARKKGSRRVIESDDEEETTENVRIFLPSFFFIYLFAHEKEIYKGYSILFDRNSYVH